jgi:hypothetical protein
VIVVARESAVVGEVFCGVDSGKCPEIVNEMRLVKIPAVEGDIAPTYRASATNSFQHRLEPSHAAKKFRSHSYMLFEEFNEAPRTEAGFVRDFSNLRGCRLGQEIFDRVLDDGVPIKNARGSFE